MPKTDDLIDQLTSELEPRHALSPGLARAGLLTIAGATAAVMIKLFGMRPDFAAGQPHAVPLLSILVVVVAGMAVALALTAMARPAVGAARGGWQWLVAALAVLPVAAVVTVIGNPAQRPELVAAEGLPCLTFGSIAGLASIILLTVWLRRGAPTSPERASWLVGLSGGTIGAIAMGLCCPNDTIAHIGVWHAGIVAVAAVASRIALPRLLRW